MKILVIDGQGGGVGKTLIAALKREMPTQPLIALGTNTQAPALSMAAVAWVLVPNAIRGWVGISRFRAAIRLLPTPPPCPSMTSIFMRSPPRAYF